MKIKILQKTTGMNAGGIEKFLINVEEKIDKDKFQFDYFLNRPDEQFYSEKIEEYGGKIYAPEWKNNKISNILNRLVVFYKFLKNNKYDILHINEPLCASSIYALIGKMAGVKSIIVHSHSDHSIEKFSFLQKLMNFLSRKMNLIVENYYFACSDEAAIWLFGKEALANKNYLKIPNGIDVNKYIFSEKKQENIRKALKINNSFIVGHVGRFYEVKNHEFLVKIFKEFLKLVPHAKLLLVGDGPLKNKIMELTEEYNIRDKVIFYGLSKNVPDLLQAMDCFVFPSHYEGLGIAVIEAQAASLPVFCSNNVPLEAKITEECYFIDLAKDETEWAKFIYENTQNIIRKNNKDKVIKAGYDINTGITQLENFYLNIYKMGENYK